jgi:CBS domain-containing protein
MRDTFDSRVGDLPIRAVPVIPADLPMGGARKIAALKKASLLFVARGAQLVGILDVRALEGAPEAAHVEIWMAPVGGCLSAATSLVRARELFVRAGTATLPVAAGAFLIGVVARADVERALRARRRPAGAPIPSIRAVA